MAPAGGEAPVEDEAVAARRRIGTARRTRIEEQAIDDVEIGIGGGLRRRSALE